MDLSILSIHFKNSHMMNRLISSVVSDLKDSALCYELIIIDNSGEFELTVELSLNGSVIIIPMGYNAGFARGVNAGLKNAKGSVIAMMNQDAFILHPETFTTLLKRMEYLPSRTVLGCRLVDEEGGFQQSIWEDDPGFIREWRFSAFNQKLHPNWQVAFEARKHTIHLKSDFVYRVNGAFFLLRNDAFLKEAYYDEDFFLYGEDVEWAIRIKRKGWKFYHDASTEIAHSGSASSPNENLKLHQIVLSDWLVLRKLFGRLYLFTFWFFCYFNLLAKQLLFLFYRVRKGIYPEATYHLFLSEKRLFIRLYVKYAWKLVFYSSFSTADSFKLNYYHDSQSDK